MKPGPKSFGMSAKCRYQAKLHAPIMLLRKSEAQHLVPLIHLASTSPSIVDSIEADRVHWHIVVVVEE